MSIIEKNLITFLITCAILLTLIGCTAQTARIAEEIIEELVEK